MWETLLDTHNSTRKGQGLVEYALVLFLVAVVVIAALATVGGETNEFVNNTANGLEAAGE